MGKIPEDKVQELAALYDRADPEVQRAMLAMARAVAALSRGADDAGEDVAEGTGRDAGDEEKSDAA